MTDDVSSDGMGSDIGASILFPDDEEGLAGERRGGSDLKEKDGRRRGKEGSYRKR